MSSLSVDYGALNDYLGFHKDGGTKKPIKSDKDFVDIEKHMFTAAKCCTCWNHRRPTSEAERDSYLEKFLGIGNGDGNTISEMKETRQYQEILENMTRALKNCRCHTGLREYKDLKEEAWPFEITVIFSNDKNEDPRSRMLWKPKITASNYRDPRREDSWKYDDDRPDMKLDPINDKFLWPNVFGQAGHVGKS